MKGSVVTAKMAGNRVDREDDVRSLDGHEHEEQRGRAALACLDHDEVPTAVALHRRDVAAEQPEDRIPFGVNLGVSLHEQFDAREHQERSEE